MASASATAGMPALDATYASPSYGYSISFPAGWSTIDGQAPWPPHTVLHHRDPHLDVIYGPFGAGTARFIGASQPVPAGTTALEFLTWQDPNYALSDCEQADPLPEHLDVDGVRAVAALNGCYSLAEYGGLIWDVDLVTSDGRGYDFTFDGSLTAAEVAAWLATIKLDPQTAR